MRGINEHSDENCWCRGTHAGTCTEPCQFDGCPMDVEAYVPPAVPRFREDAA